MIDRLLQMIKNEMVKRKAGGNLHATIIDAVHIHPRPPIVVVPHIAAVMKRPFALQNLPKAQSSHWCSSWHFGLIFIVLKINHKIGSLVTMCTLYVMDWYNRTMQSKYFPGPSYVHLADPTNQPLSEANDLPPDPEKMIELLDPYWIPTNQNDIPPLSFNCPSNTLASLVAGFELKFYIILNIIFN